MENILLFSLMLLISITIVHSQSPDNGQGIQLLCPEEVLCAYICKRQARLKERCTVITHNVRREKCDCEIEKEEDKTDECPKSREACRRKCEPQRRKAKCEGDVCVCLDRPAFTPVYTSD